MRIRNLARASYERISYAASLYLSYLGRFFLSLSFSFSFFFPSFLSSHHSEPINGLYPRRAMPEEFLYIGEREESRKHKRLDSLRESHVDARASSIRKTLAFKGADSTGLQNATSEIKRTIAKVLVLILVYSNFLFNVIYVKR